MGSPLSRLVDAFRKALEESGTRDGASLVRDIVSEPDAMNASPWEFQSAAPHLHAVPSPSGVPGSAPAVTRREPRRPSIETPAISAEEASEVVGRLFDHAATETSNRALVFSAIGAECDSAPVSAMVAEVLSCETTASVCVIDANRVARRLHTYFQVGGDRGFSDVLITGVDPRSHLVRVASNLSILPWGSHSRDDCPDFTGEQVHRVLQDLLTVFDFLIVDVAPASEHRDAAVIGALLDGVAVIASANATRREPARRTIEKLRAAGARVVGVVLANRTFPIPEAIYRKL
jgi:Mrp family chromosome partitioning ATPase